MIILGLIILVAAPRPVPGHLPMPPLTLTSLRPCCPPRLPFSRLARFPKELSCRHQSSPSDPLAGCHGVPATQKIPSFSFLSPRPAPR
jgi:hypothetical protein